ncbi:MAG: LamG-like jellyroll fold domain-containing protein [Acidobacteriota bacterium]
MRALAVGLVTLLVGLAPGLAHADAVSLSSWDYRKPITVDRLQVGVAGTPQLELVDFPLLFQVTDPDLRSFVNGGDVRHPAGHDIIFRALDDATCGGVGFAPCTLAHEIESYDPTTGALTAWVLVPSLATNAAASDTVIWIHYGSTAITAPTEDPARVWADDYAAVWHLHDDPDDSSPNGRHGTNIGSDNTTTLLARGKDFEETDVNDAIAVGNWNVPGDQLTLSAWVFFESFDQEDGRVISKSTGSLDDEHVFMMSTVTPGDRLRFRLKTGTDDATGTTVLASTSGTLMTGRWLHLAAVYDGAEMRLWIHGATVASTPKTGDLRENAWDIEIGNNPLIVRPLDGLLDEVRVSTVARDDDWLTTELVNQLVPGDVGAPGFYMIGSVATPPPHDCLACAQPGKDGVAVLDGLINTYYPGLGTAAAGASSVSVGAGVGPVGVEAGDLVVVWQVQGALIQSTDDDAYGDGFAGGDANGVTDLESAGLWELCAVAGPLVGGTLPVQCTGAGGGLQHSYVSQPADAVRGRQVFQVVRVPQYLRAVLRDGLTALPWDGTIGGLLAFDVAHDLTLAGTADVSGMGFRGGPHVWNIEPASTFTPEYRMDVAVQVHGLKAEGIAGTPGLLLGLPGNGYPDGDRARGAPGNAGGGGNAHNAGGGGGALAGAGGQGGPTFVVSEPFGGEGGARLPAVVGRLFLGGGGGSGDNNNIPTESIGGDGGGTMLIRAGRIQGTGVLLSNGEDAVATGNDGGGGGGAGGTILVDAPLALTASLTVTAGGGTGAVAATVHGAGGGGGGGFISLGDPGGTLMTPGGVGGVAGGGIAAESGADGIIVRGMISTDLPGILSGSDCLEARRKVIVH